MTGIVDSGWAAWLPLELLEAAGAAGRGAQPRHALRRLLRQQPDAARRARWERFRMVAPSWLDLPLEPDGLDEEDCYRLLAELGLVAGTPPVPVHPEPVELVLSLDHEDVRELERIRAARAPEGAGATGLEGLPSLDNVLGKGTGRNDPCPCGSGRKFKRCHGA